MGLLHGLKLAAVAIVAQAALGMARNLCPDRPRASIAVLSLIPQLLAPGSLSQIGAIGFGALAGLAFCRSTAEAAPDATFSTPVSRRVGVVCLAIFFLILGFSFLPLRGAVVPLFDAFYRSGALVFGGGHVVLPLLRNAVVVPGWVSDNAFLSGYGAAQALPGPLFTFAAYLGAVVTIPPNGILGAAIATFAIFLPGLMALMGTLPFWHALHGQPAAQAAMRGVNAAVVGLLGAALYNPVWTSAVVKPADFAIAAAGFVLLIVWRAPPLLVVLLSAAAGSVLALAG
jgi:chromate transporter